MAKADTSTDGYLHDAPRSKPTKDEVAIRRSTYQFRDNIITVIFGLVVLGAWQVASTVGWIHPIILPAPSRIVTAFVDIVTSAFFMDNLVVTAIEILLGFTIGATLAVVTGVVVASSHTARITIYPYIIAAQTPPKIILAPLFVTWFGFGMSSKVFMAVLIAFFPLFVNTLTGLMRTDEQAIKMFESLTASKRQIFIKLRFPNALPMILTGLKLCWTMAVIGVIAAEFIGAHIGIGNLVKIYSYQLKIPEVFALIVGLSVFTVVIYRLIEALERRILTWT